MFYITGEIYWTDTDLDIIQKALPDGSGLETVIYEGLVTVDGIVIDSTGRKVYMFELYIQAYCCSNCHNRFCGCTFILTCV